MTCDPSTRAKNLSPQRNRRSIRLKGYDYSQAGAYFVTICTQNRECLFGEVVNGEMRLNEAGACVVRWWNDIPHHFPGVDIDAFVVMPNHVHGIIVITDAGAGVGARADAADGDAPNGGVSGGVVGAGSPRPYDPPPVTPAVGPHTTPDAGIHITPDAGPAAPRTAPQTAPGTNMAPGADAAAPRRPSLGNVVAYFKYQTTKTINAMRHTPAVRIWQRNYYEHIIRHEASLNRIREYIQNNPLQWAIDRENPNRGRVPNLPPT